MSERFLFMRFKNYIWDFDGTLFDTYPVMMQALMKAFEKFGRADANEKEIYEEVKKGSIREIGQSYFKEDAEPFLEYYHAVEHALQTHPQPFEDAVETLRTIKENGGRHFVITHRDQSIFEYLEELDLMQYFEDVVTSDNNFPRKPNPASINFFVEKYGLDKNETVMIGDRPLDVYAGVNAGVSSILYDIDYFLEDVPADFTVHSLSDIPEI
jgi:HAD superfamily hydrolase (TIGR01549 family)